MLKKIRNTSLFMTTTLIILLLIVALSTATFAWFSANNIVNVSSISFMADTNDVEGGELAISWDRDNTESFRIDFAAPFEDENRRLYPMMPVVAPTVGVTTFDQFAISGYPNIGENLGDVRYNNQCFVYGIQTATYNQVTGTTDNKYQYDGDFTHPYVCKNSQDLTQSAFYLINKSDSFGQDITVEYSITGGLSSKLCVAVFVDDIFQGVLTNLTGIHYGKVVRDALVSSTTYATNICYPTDTLQFFVNKNDAVSVRLVAWYDGVSIENVDSGNTAILSMLRFSGAYSEPT